MIAEVGENADRGGVWLTIGEAESILPDAQLGDSISIDGMEAKANLKPLMPLTTWDRKGRPLRGELTQQAPASQSPT